MVYAAERDPLCYPGTTVLINLAGLTDQSELDDFELSMYLSRVDEPLPPGDLGYTHYRLLHHHLFQDVYAWAGQPRSIRIGKGGNWFCYPEYLTGEMGRIFSPERIGSTISETDPHGFAGRAAELLADINAGHPFRDGNGRTQLTYLALLATTAGFEFRADRLEPDMVMQAMISSFTGETVELEELISDLIT